MRDRLIELILKCEKENDVLSCYHERPKKIQAAEIIADSLLANGVIVPPCKVGDTVYTNTAMQGWYYREKDRPYKARIVFVGVNDSEEMGYGFINVMFDKDQNMLQFRISDIGKTVFLTREEAEQAVKGSE